MAKKRSFNKKPKKSKGKKRRKTGNDWYNDPVEFEGEEANQLVDDAFSDQEDGSNEENSGESSDEEQEESNVRDKGYNKLLNSLLSDNKSSLNSTQRSLIERVRMEQQGIEVMSDEEESESSDSSDSDEEETETVQQNDQLQDRDSETNSDSDGENEHEFDSDGEIKEEESDSEDGSNENEVDAENDDDIDQDENQEVNDSVFKHRFNELRIDETDCEKVPIARKWEHKSMQKFSIASEDSTNKYECRHLYYSKEWRKDLTLPLEDLSDRIKQVVKKPKMHELPKEFGIVSRLEHRWRTISAEKLRRMKSLQFQRDMCGFSQLQKKLMPMVLGYQDVQFCDRQVSNAVQIRELYALHVMNHIFKSRDEVAKHTQQLRKYGQAMKLRSQEKNTLKALGQEGFKSLEAPTPVDEEVIRDQGFTRSRVLIVLPMKNSALKLVKTLIDLMPEGSQIFNRGRFFEEFSDPEISQDFPASTREQSAYYDEDAILEGMTWRDVCKLSPDSADDPNATHDEHGNPLSNKERKRRKAALLPKPDSWKSDFDGNTDDCFRVGISFPNRKTMRLFSDFYQSDIIIASPLGLRLATKLDVGEANDSDEECDRDSQGSESENDESDEEQTERKPKGPKRRDGTDIDFLSSIEVLVIDQVELYHMQNWQHLVDVTAAALNQQPLEARPDTDFARVRELFLTGFSSLFRQSLLFGKHPDPFLNALTTGKHALCRNVYGLNVVRPVRYRGAINDVLLSGLPQRFLRIDAESLASADEARFRFFQEKVFPSLVTEAAAHTLVVVPSYFEFVRVRNLFRKEARNLDVDVAAMESRLRAQRRKLKAKGKPIPPSLVLTAADRPSQLFTCCSEYTEAPNVTRARGDFYHGRCRIMLTTERFHFFYRYRLRGVQRVVFYGPPTHGEFYSEFLNLIEPEGSRSPSSSLVLYTKTDALALERIVGTSKAKKLVSPGEENASHVFCFAD